MAQEIYISAVVSYDATTGIYTVLPPGSALNSKKGMPARLLNPIPNEDGAGIKAVPVVPRDTQCLVLKDGFRYYILGFLQPHGAVAGGDAKPSRPLAQGDIFITHSTPSKIGILKDGVIALLANKWAQMVINPVTQQLTSFFKNIRINLWSAIIEFFYDNETEKGTFKFILQKQIKTKLPSASGHDTTKTPDRTILQVGALDDDHIIDLEVEQGFPGPTEDLSTYKSTTRLGTQENGKYFEHVSRSGRIGSATTLTVEADDKSIVHLNLKKATKEIDLSLDVAGDEAVTLAVGTNKAIIHIKHTGDITLETTPGAFINIGGELKSQQLVTKAFVDQVFKNHIHSNGNQGAPTGTPLAPTPTDLGVDSKTGHFTYTTRAE